MDNISEIATSSLNVTPQPKNDESTLGQDEFLTLMLTQIRHQDPFQPSDNGEFITQMAQFSQVTSTDAMRTSLDQFVQDQSTAQLLNAASLVGRKAFINSSQVTLQTDDAVTFEYTLPIATQSATATVTDNSGAVVRTVDLTDISSGTHTLEWDGTTDRGTKASPGQYQIDVQYLDGTGESVAAQVMMSVDVVSVNLGVNGTGLSMATGDGREVSISDVTKFY